MGYPPRVENLDLSAPDKRLALPCDRNPYWWLIRFGRSLGYDKKAEGRAFWVARIKTKAGGRRQRRLGVADDMLPSDGIEVLDFAQALRAAEAWFSAAPQGRDSAGCRPLDFEPGLNYCPVGPVYTVGHALEAYIEWKRLAASPTHTAVIISLVNHHVVQRLGTVAADEVSSKVFRDFAAALLKTPPSRARDLHPPQDDLKALDRETLRKRRKTANTVISIVRLALQMAWEDSKVVSERSWRVFKRFRNDYGPRTLHLTRSEVRALLAACPPDLRRLVLGALYTGCRVTELVTMTAADVGRDGYGVYVAPGKSFRARFVFLPDEGMTFFLALTAERQGSDHLFLNDKGQPWSAKRYAPGFRRAVRAAGLPEAFCFHSLRHTYASQLVQAGAPLTAVSEQLGHANPISVMRTYGHLSPQIREAEVRQRFTSISEEHARRARKEAKRLRRWRESLHGGDWRSYARITDLSCRARTL